MKILNVVLAVLIFLLALVSAVFSFHLYAERDKMVANYNKLASAYAEGAQKLNRDSGDPSRVSNLTANALTFDQSEQLDSKIAAFNNLTEEMIESRKKMAETLVEIGGKVGVDVKAEDLYNLAGYQAILSEIQAKFNAYESNHEVLVAKVNATLKNKCNKTFHSNSDYDAIDQKIDSLNSSLNTLQREFNKQRGEAEKLAQLVIGQKKLDFQAITNAYNKVVTDRNKALNQVKSLQGEVSKLTTALNNQKQETAAVNQRLNELQQAMQLPAQRVPVLKDGSREALDMIRTQAKGRVISVDEKYGFVVISLGKNTEVIQMVGKQQNVLNPQIPVGCTLKVVRNMASGQAEHIGFVKIVKVDNDCSIAEPLKMEGSKPIQPGDSVYFEDGEIENIVKNRK